MVSQHPVTGTGVEYASWVSVGAAAKKGGQAFIAHTGVEVDSGKEPPFKFNLEKIPRKFI